MNTVSADSSGDRFDQMLGSLVARPYGALAIPIGCAAIFVALVLFLYSLADLGVPAFIALVALGVIATVLLLQRAIHAYHRYF